MVDALAIITVVYKPGPVYLEHVRALKKDDCWSSYIVIDNARDPEVDSALKELDGDPRFVHLHRPERNIGFAQACNLAVRLACTQMVAFLNPDAIPETGTLRSLVQLAEKLGPGHIVSSQIRHPCGVPAMYACRNNLTPQRMLGQLLRHHMGLKFLRMQDLYLRGCVETSCFVPACSGAFFLMRTEEFRRLGGFDARFFMHVEDLDFFKRYNEQGGRIFYTAQVFITHSMSSSKAPALKICFYKIVSTHKYLMKHFRTNWTFIGVFVLSGLTAFVLLAGALGKAFFKKQ